MVALCVWVAVFPQPVAGLGLLVCACACVRSLRFGCLCRLSFSLAFDSLALGRCRRCRVCLLSPRS